MFPLHLHHDDVHGVAGKARWPLTRALTRLAPGLKIIHKAIITAKLRRLRSELIFHSGYFDEQSSDRDAAKLPQLPMILGDKWDF
jgi:hypothetical protein